MFSSLVVASQALTDIALGIAFSPELSAADTVKAIHERVALSNGERRP